MRLGFLLGAEVGDDKESLQLENSLLEALIARLGFHLTSVTEFECGERPVLRERLPQLQRIATDAARFVEPFGFARFEGRAMYRQEVRKKFEGEKRPTAFQVFPVEGAALFRQF